MTLISPADNVAVVVGEVLLVEVGLTVPDGGVPVKTGVPDGGVPVKTGVPDEGVLVRIIVPDGMGGGYTFVGAKVAEAVPVPGGATGVGTSAVVLIAGVKNAAKGV